MCMRCRDKKNQVSERWHMYKDGRTFIVYGPEDAVREYASIRGYTDVTRSGEYVYATNTIRDEKDGPVSYTDYRKGAIQ